MIRVVLFASLRETLGTAETSLPGDHIGSVADVIAALATREGEAWRVALTAENVKVAINQVMAQPLASVSAGDEVAFFPPVTGG